MAVSLFNIPGAFHLPRVNWDLVRDWVEQNIPLQNRTQAWSTIAQEWLEAVNHTLGGTYQTIGSEKIILLVPADFKRGAVLLELAEAGLRELAKLLGGLPRQKQIGPLVIILLREQVSYFRYVASIEQDVDSAWSPGICVNDGYIHVVLRPAPLQSLRSTLLREVVHACLIELNLPRWLEVAIAKWVEESADTNAARFSVNADEAIQLRRYWKTHPLSSFWWGNGFDVPHEGRQFCDQLAQIMIRQLYADHREKLAQFVRTSSVYDAGEAAAQQLLGMSLASVAAQFLGPGPWKPVPPDSAAYVGRGSFFLDQGKFDEALQDFDRAIELAGNSSEAYFHRGLAFYHHGQIAKCISDYERSIELNPTEFQARNNLAWILATSPKEEFRNGPRALQLATAACEQTGYSAWFCLGTLAAAYAEQGDFESACNFAEQVIEMSPESDAAECRKRLQSYQSKTPWREHRLQAPYRDS